MARRHGVQVACCERVRRVLESQDWAADISETHLQPLPPAAGEGTPEHDGEMAILSWRGRLAVAVAAADSSPWHNGLKVGEPAGVGGVLTAAREVLAELTETDLARANSARLTKQTL